MHQSSLLIILLNGHHEGEKRRAQVQNCKVISDTEHVQTQKAIFFPCPFKICIHDRTFEGHLYKVGQVFPTDV